MFEKKNGSMRIVHISDMHVDGWDQRLKDEVNALAADIKDNFSEVECVVITGDLTFSGKASQFEVVAKHILPILQNSTHVAPRKIVIVPGNHDVNREAARQIERSCVEDLHNGKVSAEKVVLEMMLSAAQNEYSEFLRKTKVMKGAKEENGFRTFDMVVPRSQIGKVSFACFNTAWSCLEDAKKGEIFITQKQLDFARNNITDEGLKIAVLHHDLEWLHDSESGIGRQMKSDFDIMLMGHIHRESTVLQISPDSQVLQLTGTAFSNDNDADYKGYNVYDINPIDSNVTVYYRKYVEKKRWFVSYNDLYPDGVSTLSYSSTVPVMADNGKPRAYTYFPVVKDTHIVAQLKKTQGLDNPVYIPPVLEQVTMNDGCEKSELINRDQFLEKDVLFYSRREGGKTIFLEKLSVENNEIVYYDCRNTSRGQDSAEAYFESVLNEFIDDGRVDGMVVVLDHLCVRDSNELIILRQILSKWGNVSTLIVSTNSHVLFNSSLNNKNVSSFRKVRMRPWGVKTIEEFAVKFWEKKFPGKVPKIDYLTTCLEHSDLPVTPVIVSVFVSLYAFVDNGDNNVNLTSLIDRIADLRFSANRNDYLAILTEFALELHNKKVERLSVDTFRALIASYYDSKNLDYDGRKVFDCLADSKYITIEDNQWVSFPYYVFKDYFIAQAIKADKLSLDTLISTDVSILSNASPLILYGAIERDNTCILEKLFNSLSVICEKKENLIFDFKELDGFITYLYFPQQSNLAEEQNVVEEERKKRNQYKAIQEEFEENRKRHEQYRKSQDSIAAADSELDKTFLDRLIFMLAAVYNLYRNLETLDAAHKEKYLRLILDFHVYCNLMIIQSFKDIIQDKKFKSIIAYAVTMGGEMFLRSELYAPTLRKTICNVLQQEKNDFKRFLLLGLYATGRFNGYEDMLGRFASETKSWAAIEMMYYKVRQLAITCKEEQIPDKLMELFRTVLIRRNDIFRNRSNDLSSEVLDVKNSHYSNFHWEDKRLK